jgi:hypothetical protein
MASLLFFLIRHHHHHHLQVAQAEKRVIEAKLQRLIVASETRMKEQMIIFEKDKNELKSFLDLTVLEKNTLSGAFHIYMYVYIYMYIY